MSAMNSTILGLATVVTLAACGTGGDAPAPEPAPTVTVTETVTAAPATPEPTATASVDPGGSPEDVCAAPGLDQQAFVFVTTPTVGSSLASGDTVEGCANVFEAAFQWELLDGAASVLDSGFGTASCGTGCVGTFSFSPTFSVGAVEVGTLRVFASSAQDGSDVHVNAIPVLLQP